MGFFHFLSIVRSYFYFIRPLVLLVFFAMRVDVGFKWHFDKGFFFIRPFVLSRRARLDYFEEMQHEGILPNVVTCTCILTICRYFGLAKRTFYQYEYKNWCKSKSRVHSWPLWTCRPFRKVVNMTQDMPSLDYSIMWHIIFSACKKAIDVNVGRWIKAMGELMFSWKVFI